MRPAILPHLLLSTQTNTIFEAGSGYSCHNDDNNTIGHSLGLLYVIKHLALFAITLLQEFTHLVEVMASQEVRLP
jgi:hypothetical protein